MTEKTAEALAGELAQKVAEVRILQRVSSEVNATLELEEIYDVALRTMDELFDFHHSIILLLAEDGLTLTVVASRGYEGQAVGGKVRVGTGVIGVVAQKRRMMHLNNLGQSRAYVAAQRRQMLKTERAEEVGDPVSVPGLPNAESQIAIPLLIKDSLIGVFSIESPVTRTFSEHDSELVTIVANQIASAIHNAQLYRALRQANELLEERVRERTLELERKLRVAQDFLHDARSRLEGPLIGESAAVSELREAVALQASSLEPLLLVGPPGCGKEATARAIHDQSARRNGPFIYLSCPQLLSAERRVPAGADSQATGADPLFGKLDLARGGTLYLESIHELPREFQGALAEALGRVRDEGAEAERGVRVVASTTRDLAKEVKRSRFDLRLHELLGRRQLRVPALVDRREDVPALTTHFVRRYARQLGKEISEVSKESMERLLDYKWPGNIRELRSVVERAVIVSRGPVLEIDEESLDEGISLGSYRLVERIGSGGMGEVWLARHRLLARPAAIKLIRAGGELGHDVLVQRFQREARVTANLRSPHTVQLYDYGVGDGGDFYYVMELLAGMDLQQMVERFGPMDPERVIGLLQQACLSLSEAHECGLVHRDIKPANLFVTRLGPEYDFLKVLDFGMVRALVGEDDLRLTAQGFAQGTPAFMAPELALGETAVDGRADLYALGCSAYWLLTGRPVFDAKSPTSMLMQHVQSPPIPPSRVSELEISTAFEEVVLRCLEKDPARRPASALGLYDELGRIRGTTRWTPERAREWWRMHAPDTLTGSYKDTERPARG